MDRRIFVSELCLSGTIFFNERNIYVHVDAVGLQLLKSSPLYFLFLLEHRRSLSVIFVHDFYALQNIKFLVFY